MLRKNTYRPGWRRASSSTSSWGWEFKTPNTCGLDARVAIRHRRYGNWIPNPKLLTFHAIIVRGDDLPCTAAFQPRIRPNLAHLCARLGLVFADSMFPAIDHRET